MHAEAFRSPGRASVGVAGQEEVTQDPSKVVKSSFGLSLTRCSP